MQYRDLLPGRWGGRYIVSHIRIPGGGPVPDDVHWHRIRFQLIAVLRGEVEVVYEDQGDPFVMRAGDCVLQPPGIRHRVLHSAEDLEVVEIGCPAVHETILDHDVGLPTTSVRPHRDFGGQRFVRHVAATTPPGTWRLPGWTARDTAISTATDSLADVVYVRPASQPSDEWSAVEDQFHLLVAMRGTVDIELADHGTELLRPGDSVALPSSWQHRLVQPSDDLELMEVRVR